MTGKQLTLPICLSLVLLGCATEGQEGCEDSYCAATPACSSNGPVLQGSEVGPRPLPPTFVPLELERFPLPAARACADNGQVLHVAAGESISDALEAAAPGTTVLVEPGQYTENPESDTALGWSTDNICLRAAGDGEVVLQAAAGRRRGIIPLGGNTVIEGFTLRGFATGVAFWTGVGETLCNVTLQRMRVEPGETEFAEGIVAYTDNRGLPGAPPTVDGLLLLDSTVTGVDLGVSCNSGPCAHWWIERSTIGARQRAGSSGADAIAVESGRQIVVLDSTVYGAAADGIDTKASDVVVFGRRVLDVARNSIKLWPGGDVIDSAISGSGGDAALVGGGGGRFRYLHVLVARHGGPGDWSYVGTWGYGGEAPVQLEIVNSIFARNSSGGMFVPGGSQVSIRHTIFDTDEGKLLEIGGRRTYLATELSALQADGLGEANSIADPRFVDLASHDFTTDPGSPARDAAETVERLARDIDGGPRKSGSAPDIGVCEARD